ncbi:hypothetical protein AVEN_24828-1 [Araneus ventricosus]|uniref:Uncharacterized protein n=1 Tax=Araneus ventricosus TaxID=182803 RepID=A0A4Y2BUK9_ARAVE|nr:hypothetical protein AVEN_24828-1 [Araneus ventricosus]
MRLLWLRDKVSASGPEDPRFATAGCSCIQSLRVTPLNTPVLTTVPSHSRKIGYIFINSEIGPEGNCVRRFVIPAVNFGAADYVDLIDWQAFYVTPPTVLRHIDFHELLKMIQDDVPMDGWDFIKFLSHTKAVERIVKLVTEASRKRVGPQNRYGFIRATLESRKQMSQFEYKKDYKNRTLEFWMFQRLNQVSIRIIMI